jgi:tetratricopeptide (TPR) repeat protein
MASHVLKPLVACFALLAPLLFPTGAWGAPEPSPSEISVARRLFAEGKSAEEAGRWREAAQKFRSAVAIKDTPGMRFHLARCEEEQGAFVEALVEYDRARELIDGGMKAADVEKLLAAARERVRAKVALLTLKLPGDVQNVSVELDGRALSRSVLDEPMPINPGKHRVVAVAAGRAKFDNEVQLATGEVKQLSVELPPAALSVPSELLAREPVAPPAEGASPHRAPSASRTSDRGSFPSRTLVLATEGVLFGAGLVTGAGFLVAKNSADEAYQSAANRVGTDPRACIDPHSTPSQPTIVQDCQTLRTSPEQSSRDSAWATIGFATAGVSAAAFGLTYWLWPAGANSSQIHARASAAGFDVSVSGRF